MSKDKFNYVIKNHKLSKMNDIPCKIDRYSNCMSYSSFSRGYIPVILEREIDKANGIKSDKAFIHQDNLINKRFINND